MLKTEEDNYQIVVFLATSYEEESFAAITKQLSAHQLSIITSGLTTGVVHGCCGGEMLPHHSLSSLLKWISFQTEFIADGVLLTGGVQCINHLFADPRVHEFLEWFVGLGKFVGICQPLPYELVISSTVAQSDYLLLQNGESYAQFLAQFAECVMGEHETCN